jgi:excisionase family DNA binding protein
MTEQALARPFLSIADAGRVLGVSTRPAYNLVRDEHLPVIRLRGVMRVPTGALDEWIADREREALAGRVGQSTSDRAQGVGTPSPPLPGMVVPHAVGGRPPSNCSSGRTAS